MNKPVLILILPLLLFYCKSKNAINVADNEHSNNTAGKNGLPASINIEDYDSVKYYTDANWATFKGIHEVKKEEVTYPYVLYGYKKDAIDVNVIFGPGSVKKWQLLQYRNHWYYLAKEYDRERQDSIYIMRIFQQDSSSVQLLCPVNPLENETFKPTTVVIWQSGDNQSLSQKIFMGYPVSNAHFKLEDFLLPDEAEIGKQFSEYIYTKRLIKNKQIYRTYELYRKDAGAQQIDDRELVENNNLRYDSFFMFYCDQ